MFVNSGTQQPKPLQCLAIQGKIVFASYGNVIKAFKRGREVNAYISQEGDVISLLPFGEQLVSIDDQNCLRIWQIKKSGKSVFCAVVFKGLDRYCLSRVGSQ